MKKLVVFFLFIPVMLSAYAQDNRPDFRNDYYNNRRNMQESMPAQQGAIVMFGNSITERGMWDELFPGKAIVNRGIGGDRIPGMIDRMPYVADTHPKQLFILAGVNDLLFTDVSLETFEKEYTQLVQIVKEHSPQTKIYLQSIFAVNDEINESTAVYFKDKNEKIDRFNEVVKKIAEKNNLTYIDIAPLMRGHDGKLNAAYTVDGIHLNGKGYTVWVSVLKKYIE